MTTIEQTRREVESSVRKIVALGERSTGTATAVEEEVWAACLELGRAVMTSFFARRAAQPRPASYEHDGARYEIAGRETTEVGTRFGKVEIAQPVGERSRAFGGRRDLPLMRELALPAGFTLPVVTLFGRLCAMMAFAQARELFRSLFGWSPSQRAVLRMVDATGEQAQPFLEQAAPPEDDGEVLVIEADGKGAPAISSREHARRTQPRSAKASNRRHARRSKRRANPRPRRGPGKKSKNAKVAAVGAIYTLRRDANGKLEGPINKRVYATFKSYRALFKWLRDEADKRGYGTKKFTKVLFVADGAEVLWNLKKEFFPEAHECLDWFHAVEKLWAAGKAICRGTRRQREVLEAWVARMKKVLRAGKVRELLAELMQTLDDTPLTGPGNKYRREVLDRVINHFTENATRMRYKHLRSEDLPIGSGVIEGAVRHLVGVRLDGPGMRWGRDRAEAVLHLRCVLINGQWPTFETFLASRPGFRLRGRPVPTRTHDAKPVVTTAA
jgi:hypothetical protein